MPASGRDADLLRGEGGDSDVTGHCLARWKPDALPSLQVADGERMIVFDFTLAVKPGRDGAPNFTGPFASGPAGDRFVYLSWRSIPRGVWINRIKARLADIDWPLIERAQGRRLAADLSDWSPGGGRRRVDWRLP